MRRFTNKTAIVTGAGRGIGLAIAERLLAEGANVTLADVNITELEKQIARLNIKENRAFAVQIDVSKPAEANSMAQKVLEYFGSIDILVNNAGITGYTRPVIDYEPAEWRRVMAINLDGVFYCSKAVLPAMLAQKSGHIVNVASISGKEGNPNMPAYSTSKAGVIGFTKALGKELAAQGVIVNCVTPAIIETDLLKGVSEESLNYMVAKIPMGRVGRPEEVAALVAWLCSDECSFTTGGVFDLSGGRATY